MLSSGFKGYVLKNTTPSEEVEQINLVLYLNYNYPDLLFWHTPSGGYRNKVEAVKLKRLGTVAGVPDLFFPSFGKKGLFIEMKRQKGGSVSKDQKKVIAELERIGYQCFICKGCEEAKKVINKLIKC